MRSVAEGVATVFGTSSEVRYDRLTDPVVNDAESTSYCQSAAECVAGEANVLSLEPVMGGEDFGGFLQVRPGAFMVIGQGEPEPSSPHNFGVHSPSYDFNDAIIPIAANYFAELAERRLPVD
jgi:hippurate hydrolase